MVSSQQKVWSKTTAAWIQKMCGKLSILLWQNTVDTAKKSAVNILQRLANYELFWDSETLCSHKNLPKLRNLLADKGFVYWYLSDMDWL